MYIAACTPRPWDCAESWTARRASVLMSDVSDLNTLARRGTLSNMTLEAFTLETFAGRVGERFGLEIEGVPPFDLRLEVEAGASRAGWPSV